MEPIDKEADQIQIMALLNYMEIPIRIVYLDGNLTNIEPSSMVFPMDVQEDPSIILLYRPGHYDILYKWCVYCVVDNLGNCIIRNKKYLH